MMHRTYPSVNLAALILSVLTSCYANTDLSDFLSNLPIASVAIPLTLSPNGRQYLVRANVGTPPQTVYLVFDTSSSDTVLFHGNACNSTKHASDCFRYNDSSTFQIQYLEDGSPLIPLFDMAIDGEIVSDGESSFVARDLFSLSNISQSHESTLTMVQNLNFASNIDESSSLYSLVSSDGVLGAAYESLARVSCPEQSSVSCTPFLQLLRPGSSGRGIFSLHLRPQHHTSTLLLGGIDEAYRKRIQWSHDPSVSSADFHRFTIESLSICGVELFSNYTERWHALVDTASSCLRLPAEFFDMVMSWIPVECIDESVFSSSSFRTRTCYLPAGAPLVLPELVFRLGVSDDVIHLPLVDLLLPFNPDGRHKLCVERGISLSDSRYPNIMKSIHFGSRALHSIYTVFEMEHRYVGMANVESRNETDSRTTEHCNAAVKCRGHEVAYLPKNTCLEPRCYNYVLYHTNKEKQTCEISPGAELALVALIVALVTSEFVTFWYRRRLLKHINAEIPSL